MQPLSVTSPSRRRIALWVEALLQPAVWRRASVLGVPVGLLQAVINQGDVWARNAVDGVVIAKTIISPLVTFSVALFTAAGTYIDKKLQDKS